MYTLKFIHCREDGTDIETCVRCPHYEVSRKIDGECAIIAYPKITAEDGVERWIKREHPPELTLSYDVCFVENEDGKTIGRYSVKEMG